MDLDRALTFLVVATAFVSGAAAAKMKAWRWLGVQLANLAVVGAAWLFARDHVSWIIAPVWLVTVIAPSLSLRWSDRMMVRERFGVARVLARVAATLHPTPVTRLRVLVADAQGAEQAGRRAEEEAILDKLGVTRGGETVAHLFRLRLDYRWAEIRAWLEERPGTLAVDPVALSFYLRSLGELGAIDSLVAMFGVTPKPPSFTAIEGQALLFAMAFGGRETGLEAVLAAHHADMPDEGKRLWRLTAANAAGKDVRDALTAMTSSKKPRLAAVARMRLDQPAATITAETRTALDALETSTEKLEPAGLSSPSASTVIIAVNLYVFLRELPGGSENSSNLFQMGALYTDGLDVHEAYRIFTATVLHYGLLHVAMNMLALLVLGRALEAIVGRARFVVIYLGAGIAANALDVLFAAYSHKPHVVVGASGCVMGIAGALLVRRIIRWRVQRASLARGEVVSLASLLVLQTIFDTITPEIAGAVHLFGAAAGALLALVVGRRRLAPPRPATHRTRAYALGALLACMALLEVAWAGSPRLGDPEACSSGDLGACEARCEALFGARVSRDPDGGATPVPLHGIQKKWLLHDCEQLAVRLYAGDGGSEDDRRAHVIAGAVCEAGVRSACRLDSDIERLLDHESCFADDLGACERDCSLALGPGAARREPPFHVGPPLPRDRETDARIRSCIHLGASLADSGAPPAAERAHAIFEAACDAGSRESCFVHGFMLESGTGVAKDTDGALDVFAALCRAGDVHGCTAEAAILMHAPSEGDAGRPVVNDR